MTAHVHLTSSGWQEKSEGKIKQRGTCWPDSVALLQAESTQKVSDTLQLQNGFYALVWENSSTLYAAVDHIRSIPLFYALKGSDFYLSDDADWVREQAGNTVMDEVAKEEFQLAGYVTGQDTLYPDVKQLQAGEFLCINTLSESPKVETERYYRFLHTEPETFNEQKLLQQLDKAALASIDNLIRFANGRQIVIPLSGGYDSRLIATLLKRRGYDNILTFTYGVPGNKESAYSKRVADALGLKWHFVEYSSELWRNVWQTEERWEYQKWASGWSSLPHVQDWLAIKIIKEKAVVNDNCVFVPGHGAMAVLSHLRGINLLDDSKLLMTSIMKRKFDLSPASTKLKLKVERKLEGVLEEISTLQKENLSSFSTFEWQERQAKFLVNSVRVYESYNYSWWMPLWDMRFVELWHRIPCSLRSDKEWYVSYVKNLFSECADWKEKGLDNASQNLIKNSLGNMPILKNQKLKSMLKKVLQKSRSAGVISADRFPVDRHKDLVRQGYSSNGIYAYFFLVDARDRRS